MQRFLLITGTVLMLIGLGWPWLSKLPFGRLPGDINIVRDGIHFHFPITTCLLLSVVASVIVWLYRR